MNYIKQEFIVTEHPPWYLKSDYKDAFNCESTQGLFNKVFNLMICKLEELSEREKRYKPKTIYKIIRSLVIQDADTIQQKPTRSLLLALMDLVDIDEGNGFESMAGVDRAGVKHLLLAYGDYTAFYIPNKELISTNGKKVIPVVTQYSENDNFVYYDISRSMIGTYYTKGNEKSIFVQEVLLVPGLKSLELLKSIMGNKFEFWDMTLEVPTHLTALTPSFQHIQPFQLLCTENKNPFTLSNADALVSPMDEIHPMCCVLDTASAEMLNKKHEASLDCFTEKQLRCDLKHFHYTNGDSRIVYFGRNEFLDGKQVNLVPVVTLRKGQAEAPELYVSTTARFCRAVTHCCIKGKGQPVSGWISTLKELKRETFITGTDMCQEIHNRALTAFIERVNPNSLYNDIPKHVESMIMDPIMVEVVELAIEFMGRKIPNAFAVAELLYCPIEKVQEYLKFWSMCSSDNTIHTAVWMKRIRMVEERMRMDLDALSHTASRYVQKRCSEDGNSEMVSACEELFKHQTLDNPVKIYKMWYNMTKLRPVEITDPELVQAYSKSVVLYSKLCINSKREGVCSYPQSGSSSPHSTEAQDADVSSKCLADVEEHSKDETMTEDDSLYSIVTPESIPISTWKKNMSTLLLSEPWLHDDDVRREAVCTLLGLDDTLLDRRYGDVLRKWVIDNRTVVKLLQTYGLQDRLSKALVDCLESTSINKWRHNVLLSLQGTRDQLRGYSDPEMSNKINPSAQSNKGDMCSKGVGKCAKKHAPVQHPKAVKQDRLDSKSNKSSTSKSPGSKSDKKASDSRAHCSRHRYSHNHEHPWLREAKKLNSEEEEEDLEATMYSEKNKSPDKYDYSNNYSDDLIDGRHTEEKYSSGKEGNEAFCAQVKKSAKKADMCQEIHNRALTAFIERVNPNSLYNDIPKHVESMIMDPILVEVVELAIEFMGRKIPNAFAVAELLYCPIEKVQEYLKFWSMCSSDNTIHTAVWMKRIRMVEERMRMDLDALSHTTSSYVQKRCSEDGNSEMVSACEELFKHQTLDNPVKIYKMWYNMTKLRPVEITDPELLQAYSKSVVLYSKLCINSKREGVCSYPQSGSSSPHSTEAQDADVSSKCLADVEEHSKDETMTEDDSLYSIVTPESIPISTWKKNMSTLLLSEPWLHDDDVRREAVCTLLGLDDTLLDRRHGDVLREWVIDNRAVVKLLQTYGLQDRLSKALVDCLESTSINKWRHNVLLSLQGTRDQLRGYSDPEMSNKINPSAQSNKGDMCSKGVGKCAKKHAPVQHPKAVKQDRLDSKSNKSSTSKSPGSKSDKKASDSRAHCSRHRYSHNHEHPWLREAKKLNSEEEEEDLEATMYSEKNKCPDKYDYSNNYSDDLIDGRHTEEKYSSGKEGNEAFCAQVKKSAKKATFKTKNVNQRRKYKRVPHSDSEEDEYSPEPACSGMKEEIRGYKRPLKSDSEDELIKPDVKRVKRIKENCHPDKSEKKRSRNAKVVKEPVQRYDRGDKTCAKMKQHKSDKRCGRVKLTKNKLTLNLGFPLYKSKPSHSETEDYKWKGKRVGGKKKVNPSKKKCSRLPVRDSEQEERRLHKKTQKGGPDNTPREKLQKTELGRSLVPQDALKKQDLSNHPRATWSNLSPGVSQSHGRRSSGEAAKVAKLTHQAAWPKDTLQHESSDHEGERERDREEEGLSEEDSDVESDFNDRLNRHENTGCSNHEADYSEDEYLVIM